MILWEEPANFHGSAYESSTTEENTNCQWPEGSAKANFYRDLLELIERDRSHPSVCIWGIINEGWNVGGLHTAREIVPLDQDPEKQEYLAALYDRVKQLDSTRPVVDNSMMPLNRCSHVKTDILDYHIYSCRYRKEDGSTEVSLDWRQQYQPWKRLFKNFEEESVRRDLYIHTGNEHDWRTNHKRSTFYDNRIWSLARKTLARSGCLFSSKMDNQ